MGSFSFHSMYFVGSPKHLVNIAWFVCLLCTYLV